LPERGKPVRHSTLWLAIHRCSTSMLSRTWRRCWPAGVMGPQQEVGCGAGAGGVCACAVKQERSAARRQKGSIPRRIGLAFMLGCLIVASALGNLAMPAVAGSAIVRGWRL
jgi:hypothetical protein